MRLHVTLFHCHERNPEKKTRMIFFNCLNSRSTFLPTKVTIAKLFSCWMFGIQRKEILYTLIVSSTYCHFYITMLEKHYN